MKFRALFYVLILMAGFTLWYAYTEKHAIDKDTWEQLERNRPVEIREAGKRKLAVLVMFQHTGLLLSLFVLPAGLFMFQNRQVYLRQKKRKQRRLSLFEGINSVTKKDFEIVLVSRYPQLTPHEVRLCEMLKANFSSKEIATALNITQASVNTARYRLRKKLNLDKEEQLHHFLNRL